MPKKAPVNTATKRLKVYATRMGLSAWAVAALNQKEALRALDLRDHVFASGDANVVTDPAAIEAAMKNSG